MIFIWTWRIKRLPVSRLDDGVLTHNQPMDMTRLNRWIKAKITVKGWPEWVFVKLSTNAKLKMENEEKPKTTGAQ